MTKRVAGLPEASEGGGKTPNAAASLSSADYCSAATGVDPKPTPEALKTVTVFGTSSTAARMNG